jgi:hypothetical protein
MPFASRRNKCGRRPRSSRAVGYLVDYRRQVTLRCDGDDFVVATHTDGLIIFRTKDAEALRKLCRSLRWEIHPRYSAAADNGTLSLVPTESGTSTCDGAEPDRAGTDTD